MANRTWKRINERVGLGLFYEILDVAVDQMLNDLERGNNGKVSLAESGLFEPDDGLTNKGCEYVQEAFESIGDLLNWSDTLSGLISVLDKECFTYFMIMRAAAKQAEEEHTPKRTGPIG